MSSTCSESRRRRPIVAAMLAGVLFAPALAGQQTPEATSLTGQPLFAPAIPDAARARMAQQLEAARADLARDPASADALIWVGRRTAYLGRFQEAIRIFSDGIARFPADARFYRHRGHRYITVRDFPRAIADLEKAAALVAGAPDQIEPDGQPNARNVPTSSLQSNIFYHLALARYLSGDFAGAADGWRRARDVLDNADNLVATSHWLYLSLRRAGRTDDARAVLAPIRTDLDVIENGSYHQLLLLYRGERTAGDLLRAAAEGAGGSAIRYGVGAWHDVEGRRDQATAIWRAILTGADWPSFGFVAAEAELARPGADRPVRSH